MKIKHIYRNIVYRIKIILAYVYIHTIGRKYLNKEIWLISEKRTEARDNGYHLFKYITTQRKDIEAVYVIDKKAPDYKKIEQLGKVVQYDSFRHFVYFIISKYRIGGQVQGGKPYIDVAKQDTLKILRNSKQIHFYIKHGIAKDDIPRAYDYRKAKYDVMLCGATKEYEYYKARYNYPNNRIYYTGLCRFDNLLEPHDLKNYILVMPTYRSWLRPQDSAKDASSEETKRFLNSEYFIAYKEILENKKLQQWLKEKGMKLLFYMHYTMQPYLDAVKKNTKVTDEIIFASRTEYDVQELLMESKLLITDYSSVFFDFGYMEKSVAYFQFDQKKYREEHYAEGWFNYKRDGFGPILTKPEEVVNYVCSEENGIFVVEDEFSKKIIDMYTRRDQSNCKRVVDVIKNIKLEKCSDE